MSRDSEWQRLLDFLAGWSVVTEVAPGRLDVTIVDAEGDPAAVQIVMTPEQWSDMVGIPWGNFGDAAHEVKRTVLEVAGHEPFLVYGDYELIGSATPERPADPDLERLAELAREHPEGFGRWVALDADGNVEGELGPPGRSAPGS